VTGRKNPVCQPATGTYRDRNVSRTGTRRWPPMDCRSATTVETVRVPLQWRPCGHPHHL